MREVVLVDSGGTNLSSVRCALRRLGVEARDGTSRSALRAASHVILPGVGAAAPGMRRLRENGLADEVVSLRQPVLGICLGMQLLFEHSDESDTECLGIVPGRVRKFDRKPGLRVPHMGWNAIDVTQENALFKNEDAGDYAYFVHSFAAPVGEGTVAAAEHGDRFSAAIQHQNFFGVQFHPERSADFGARVLRRFLEL